MSEFAQISSFMDDSQPFPEPANTLAMSLGLANLDVLKFVPMACAFRMSYYDNLRIKVFSPLLAVALLWTWPAFYAIRGRPTERAVRGAAKITFFWFELILVSVSSTIAQCFMSEWIQRTLLGRVRTEKHARVLRRCDQVGDELYLRAQLTLPCDGSKQRVGHILLATMGLLIFPIGVPLFMFAVMHTNRHQINKLMLSEGTSNGVHHTVLEDLADRTAFYRQKRRSQSMHLREMNLDWLTDNLKNFKPNFWWAGVFILVTRVCQTSLMVLCNQQIAQASLASLVTITSINIQREAWPFRRDSDNVAAYLGQWCVLFVFFSVHVCWYLICYKMSTSFAAA